MDFSQIDVARGILWYLVFLFSTTCHEAAHAWSALKLGDPTAYEGGQVTLHPWPHIRREPFGMVLVPILSFVLGGWMLGWASAPYDPAWALRHPKRNALMSLAGPVANFVLALLAGFTLRFVLGSGLLVPSGADGMASLGDGVLQMLWIAFALNVLLGTFNLIPFPPLDGSGVIQLLMGENLARRWQSLLHEMPMLGFAGLLLAWKLSGPVLTFVMGWASVLVLGR